MSTQKRLMLSGTRPEQQNGLQQFQELNGSFDPYAVTMVTKTAEYKTKAGKCGLTHVDEKGVKHAWPLGVLSKAADEGKVIFLKADNTPANIGEAFVALSFPEKIGRSNQGEMLI